MVEALREELADLTASVRAFLEWHAGAGADGLPGHPAALHEALGASSSEGALAPRRADRGFPGLEAPSPPVPRGGSAAAGAPAPHHPEQRGAAASPPAPHAPEQRSAAASASAPHAPEQRSAA